MIMMNSIFTTVEHYMLQFLGCKNNAQALSVLCKMKIDTPYLFRPVCTGCTTL